MKSKPEKKDSNNFVLYSSTCTLERGQNDESDAENMNGMTKFGITVIPGDVAPKATSRHSAFIRNTSDSLFLCEIPSTSGGSHQMTVFVPSDMMKRIMQGKDDFETHLNRASHLPFGAFDPWELVEQ